MAPMRWPVSSACARRRRSRDLTWAVSWRWATTTRCAGGLYVNDSIGAGDTAWRLAAHRYTSDGFRRDAFLGRSDTNGYDENLLRLRVTSTLGQDVKLDVTAMYSDIDNGYDAWTLDNSRVTLSDKPGVDSQRSLALAVRLDADLNDAVSLRSVTTVADADIGFSYDGDWGNEAYWGVNGPYDFTEQIDRQRRNISQDLRFTSRNREQGGWVAGVYALHMDEDYSLLDLYNARRLPHHPEHLPGAEPGRVRTAGSRPDPDAEPVGGPARGTT